jgi:hypothetical protein
MNTAEATVAAAVKPESTPAAPAAMSAGVGNCWRGYGQRRHQRDG